MLIGNQSVLNKSLALFSNGTSTAGAYAGQTRSNWKNPAIQKGRIYFWAQSESFPDGYNITQAINPGLKGKSISSFTRVTGIGEVTGTLWEVKLSEASLSGSGDITQANLASLVPSEATISGSGSITQAEMAAVSALASALSGSGSMTAELSSFVPLDAVLSGTGSIAGTTNLTGIGSLAALIEVGATTELTAAAVAQAVADIQIETGYDLTESLRLITSALAGKLSGAPGTTITIRDITDSKDRIIATVDSNGNRTAVTYDVSE